MGGDSLAFADDVRLPSFGGGGETYFFAGKFFFYQKESFASLTPV